MTQASSVTLVVSFDVDQVSMKLDHIFTSSESGVYPLEGLTAGSVYLNHGQLFYVEAWGGGKTTSKFTNFEIVDCCIITRPQITQICQGHPTEYSPPSPFKQKIGACNALQPLKFHLTETDQGLDYLRLKKKWDGNFTVGANSGRWDFSFVVTVKIFRGADDKIGESRVFSFDPECEVGSGI